MEPGNFAKDLGSVEAANRLQVSKACAGKVVTLPGDKRGGAGVWKAEGTSKAAALPGTVESKPSKEEVRILYLGGESA